MLSVFLDSIGGLGLWSVSPDPPKNEEIVAATEVCRVRGASFGIGVSLSSGRGEEAVVVEVGGTTPADPLIAPSLLRPSECCPRNASSSLVNETF
jgi:hypothetical protein